jgi:hypothetical protein
VDNHVDVQRRRQNAIPFASAVTPVVRA